MSDTDKCPDCGYPIRWLGEQAWCRSCDWISPLPSRKGIDFKYAYLTATHRIRELEARIAAKDEALKEIAAQAAGSRIVNIAREALKK